MPSHFDQHSSLLKSQSSLIDIQVTNTSPLIWTYFPQTAGIPCWGTFPYKTQSTKETNKNEIKIAHLILPVSEIIMDFQ